MIKCAFDLPKRISSIKFARVGMQNVKEEH